MSGYRIDSLLLSVSFLPPLLQTGQPAPILVRLLMTANHSCPHSGSGHSHQAFLCEPCCTSLDVRLPFKTGCHWSATSGYVRDKRLRSVTTLPAQAGHPLPALVRLDITASHECPHFGHNHQAFLFEPPCTLSGVRLPFLVGCHSAAAPGHATDRLLRSVTTCPAQAGQPLPRPVRLATSASHSCPHSAHSHQALLFEPPCTLSGVR